MNGPVCSMCRQNPCLSHLAGLEEEKKVRTEYRVTEQYSGSLDIWNPHGYVGFNGAEAAKDFKHKIDFYGKFGRKFRIEIRTVEPWKEFLV